VATSKKVYRQNGVGLRPFLELITTPQIIRALNAQIVAETLKRERKRKKESKRERMGAIREGKTK
jgi:hypothetical protein